MNMEHYKKRNNEMQPDQRVQQVTISSRLKLEIIEHKWKQINIIVMAYNWTHKSWNWKAEHQQNPFQAHNTLVNTK